MKHAFCPKCGVAPVRRTWARFIADDLDMRFSDSGMELGFVASLSPRLTTRAAWVGCVSLVFCVARLAMVAPLERRQFDTDARYEAARRGMAFDAAFACWSAILAGFALAQLRWRVVSCARMESFVAGWFAVVLAIGAGTETPDASVIETKTYQMTWLLLFVDVVITASHICVPIRWCKLWPVEVLCFATYPVTTAYFNKGNVPITNALTISALILFSIVGGRSVERQERLCFHSVIVERTLRAQVEFQLSQQGQRQMRATSSIGDAASIATGEFSDTCMVAPGRLQRLAALGMQEHWLVDPADLSLTPDCMLGQGGFGVVMAGTLHGTPVAVKFPLKSEEGLQRMPGVITELRVLRHVRHPNIAAFHGAVVDRARGEVALVLELVVGPSLGEHVVAGAARAAEAPGVTECFAVALGVCRALRHLHGHRPAIVHGDLKPNNILLETWGGRVVAKLLDFGLSRILASNAEPLGGSLRWMAPELLQHREAASELSTAADVFSFGRVVHFAISGAEPFQRHQSRSIHDLLSKGVLGVTLPPRGLADVTRESWKFATECLHMDPGTRPAIVDICHRIESLSRAPVLVGGAGRTLTCRRCPGAEEVGGAVLLSSTTAWEFGLEVVRAARARCVRQRAGGGGRRGPGSSRSASSRSSRSVSSSRRSAPLPSLPEEAELAGAEVSGGTQLAVEWWQADRIEESGAAGSSPTAKDKARAMSL